MEGHGRADFANNKERKKIGRRRVGSSWLLFLAVRAWTFAFSALPMSHSTSPFLEKKKADEQLKSAVTLYTSKEMHISRILGKRKRQSGSRDPDLGSFLFDLLPCLA